MNSPESIATTEAYNKLIPGVVAEKAAAGLNVQFVDMSVLKPGDITPTDALHLSDDGYEKVATTWHKALLKLGVENGTLALNHDSLANIENLVGSAYNDELAGDALDNDIMGGSGNDFIEGRAGNDVLSGGNGRDTFHYELGSGDDIITDFRLGTDHLSAGAGVTIDTVQEIDTNSDGILDTVVNLIGDARITLLGLSDVIDTNDLWV